MYIKIFAVSILMVQCCFSMDEADKKHYDYDEIIEYKYEKDGSVTHFARYNIKDSSGKPVLQLERPLEINDYYPRRKELGTHLLSSLHARCGAQSLLLHFPQHILKAIVEITVMDELINKQLEIALADATICNDHELVEQFIDYGVDVNTPTRKGMEPIIFAAARCSFLVLSRLLAAGAKVDIADNMGYLPVAYAAQNKACRDLLLGTLRHENYSKWERITLRDAFGADDGVMVKQLIKDGLSPDVEFIYDESLIINAIDFKKRSILKVLIDAGANLKARGKCYRKGSYNYSLLDLAIDDPECEKLVREGMEQRKAT